MTAPSSASAGARRPCPDPAARPDLPGRPDPAGLAAAAGDRLAGDVAGSDLPRTLGDGGAGVWQLTLLIQVLIYLHDYRQPAVPLAVWLGLLAATGWMATRVRGDRPVRIPGHRRDRGGGRRGRPGRLGPPHARHRDSGLVGHRNMLAAGPHRAEPARPGSGFAERCWSSPRTLSSSSATLGVTSLGLARLAATAYTLVVLLVVVAALRPTLRAHARTAARSAALASRSAARRAVAAAIREDRRNRLALLEVEALPLLRGIADGTLDPADSKVRERCAAHAATLRRALVDRVQNAGWLLAELEPALRVARARGLPADIQVVGDPGRPVWEVASATLAAVDGVLSALPPQPVTLTILASGNEVELYVTFSAAPDPAPDLTRLAWPVPAAARWCAAVDIDDTDAGCLEIRWHKAAANEIAIAGGGGVTGGGVTGGGVTGGAV